MVSTKELIPELEQKAWPLLQSERNFRLYGPRKKYNSLESRNFFSCISSCFHDLRMKINISFLLSLAFLSQFIHSSKVAGVNSWDFPRWKMGKSTLQTHYVFLHILSNFSSRRGASFCLSWLRYFSPFFFKPSLVTS